ncbi:MAG: immunoglobulin domain-containing protein [Opitutaceae bacterium]|nr:immunoglobulin domain-containing protein [Opitutaceae bacterium]
MALRTLGNSLLIRLGGGLLALGLAAAVASAADYAFTHLAGPLGGPGNADGPASIARFNTPNALARDPMGNIYVSDAGNRTIRKITPAGQVSTLTLAGADGGLANVGYSGLAVDAAGYLYVSYSSYNQHKIFKISPDGTVRPFAGSSYGPFYDGTRQIGVNVDGQGGAAAFFEPTGLAVDAAGNVIVADTGNNTVRRITPAGTVTTLAGDPDGGPGSAGYVDGPGTTARFTRPASVAVDSAGNILVADLTTIRRIAPDGTVTTLAGSGGQSGSTDGNGSAARFLRPCLAVDASDTIFIGDGTTVRKLAPDGTVTTLAGAAGQPEIFDGVGSAARFISPSAVLPAGDGSVLVADNQSDAIRRVAADGTVTPFAGVAGNFGATAGTGAQARFNQPWGAAYDRDGNAYVADRGNNLVRRITPAGVVTNHVATNEVGGREPVGVAIDRQGNLFVVCARNTIVRVAAATGAATLYAGKDLTFGKNDGPAATATFHYPLGITIGPDDTLYVADTGNKCIRTISPQGVVGTLAITSADVPLSAPNGITIDAAGNLYVVDRTLSTLHKITPAGVMTVLAGSPSQYGATDGVGAAARFSGPCGVAADAQGNLFVTDNGNNLIRKVTPAGAVTTIGGTFGIYGSADGTGPAAHFLAPLGVAAASDGAVLVTEELNSAVRIGRPLAAPVILTHPSGQAVAPGATATFTVTAAGYPAPTYQWYLNNVALSGATGATLTVPNAAAANAGSYTVTVSNSLGSAISNAAVLSLVTSNPTPAPSGGGGGGGGGAPSPWFLVALAALWLARRFVPSGRARA